MAEKMNDLCMGCMTPVSGGTCPVCGRQSGTGNGPDQLPVGTILNGQYMAGAAIDQGIESITYAALDLTTGERVDITEYFPQATATRLEGGYNVSTMTGDETAKAFISHVPGARERFLENGTAYAVVPAEGEQGKEDQGVWKTRLGVIEDMRRQEEAWAEQRRAEEAQREQERAQRAAELEKKEQEKDERVGKDRLNMGRALGAVGAVLGLACAVIWGWTIFEMIRERSFAESFFKGYSGSMSPYAPIHWLIAAALFALLAAGLAWLVLSSVAGLRGKPRKKGFATWAAAAAWFAAAIALLLAERTRAQELEDFALRIPFVNDVVFYVVILAPPLLIAMLGVRSKPMPALIVGVAAAVAVTAAGLVVGRTAFPASVAEGETYTGPGRILARQVHSDIVAVDYYIDQYDSAGALIRQDVYEEGKLKSWNRYENDEHGNVVRLYPYGEELLSISFQNTYDDAGNLILTEREGKPWHDYTYDEAGRLTEETNYNSYSYAHYIYTYEGDRLVRRDAYDKNGELDTYTLYTSSADGVLTQAEEFVPNPFRGDELIGRMEYDSNGDMTRREWKNYDWWEYEESLYDEP